jgi:hypothetical protein
MAREAIVGGVDRRQLGHGLRDKNAAEWSTAHGEGGAGVPGALNLFRTEAGFRAIAKPHKSLPSPPGEGFS